MKLNQHVYSWESIPVFTPRNLASEQRPVQQIYNIATGGPMLLLPIHRSLQYQQYKIRDDFKLKRLFEHKYNMVIINKTSRSISKAMHIQQLQIRSQERARNRIANNRHNGVQEVSEITTMCIQRPLLRIVHCFKAIQLSLYHICTYCISLQLFLKIKTLLKQIYCNIINKIECGLYTMSFYKTTSIYINRNQLAHVYKIIT